MGIVIAVWLSRFDAAVLLRLVKMIGWIVSVFVPGSSFDPARSRRANDALSGHLHPAHPAPGLWYALPRAALIGWSITGVAAAVHLANRRAVISSHHTAGMHAP